MTNDRVLRIDLAAAGGGTVGKAYADNAWIYHVTCDGELVVCGPRTGWFVGCCRVRLTMKGDRELFRLMVRGEDSRDYPVGVSGETQRKFQSALEDWVWWIQRTDSVRGWELISHGGDEYLRELPNGDLRANGWLTADGITDVVRAVVEGRIVTWGHLVLRVEEE